ncbi:TonB-dependent receptor plug domain-containing protein [Sphingopyxis granuli]|uniref:TonB-dependent receptor plug domain-containing protein n=1 Tax=Sphingopyxis granuli TaxID=267128 RepID=UPI0023EB6170|nr:TonB-dependent receptor plug domain-containing protein [Sphingopyxis granuli]
MKGEFAAHQFLAALLAGIAAIAPTITVAQEAGSNIGTYAPDDGAYNGDEIIVTAQYRRESLQRVPLAITSVTGDSLQQSGVSDLTGLSASVPGLQLSSYSTLSPQVFIRGVGSNDDGITSEGAVGVYLDGVFVGRASSALFDLYDLERVEVLRGPQGTLYGRNTNGGAIKIETVQPGPDFHAGLELGYGRFNQRSMRGIVSGPLAQNVFVKLSARFRGQRVARAILKRG